MIKESGSRHLFVIGAVVGMLGGLILGSVATMELEDHIRKLLRRASRKLSNGQHSVRWELLGQ